MLGPLRAIAKQVLPPIVRRPLTRALREEIIGLEGRKSDYNIAALREFPELRNSAWWGLGSVAYELVCHYRPQVIVELGTHMGYSAFAMGLALKALANGGELFAVDTWEGDPHAGYYGDDVLATFLRTRDQLGLGKVVEPLRMTFDEARHRVATPIDLLHVDGLHTLMAVRQDFAGYRPLMRSGALVMFHDVRTIFPEMRRFWRSLALRYESYQIPYSHGLGVIRIP
jgi:hypothetical protein